MWVIYLKKHTPILYLFFFFNDTATTEIYPLSLHDALPISRAASIVPAQVRKSFAVMSRPVISRRYALTSSDEIVWRLPELSMYLNSSCPGRSWHCWTMRARRRSVIDTV